MLITLALAGAMGSAACLGCGLGTYSTADGTMLLSLEFGKTAESVDNMAGQGRQATARALSVQLGRSRRGPVS